jgi:hypothetical protein
MIAGGFGAGMVNEKMPNQREQATEKEGWPGDERERPCERVKRNKG